MDLSVLMLSRVQFALTIMFHYLFPPLSIGLGGLLVIMEAMYLKTADPQYEVMAKFWTKIFAVNFAVGVATGIVMEFQFGTNWATYSRYVGDVFGSALAAEGIFAFFLESGFLAVLVFGWDRVSPRTHFFSTCMVALGAFFSSIWIVVANSWQQTPAGFHIVGQGLRARAEITDFWAMVFSPSSMQRLSHTLIGAYVLAAFFVMSIAAWYILKGRHLDFAKKSFGIALVVAALASLAAPISGDMQARKVAHTQPAKLAAMEAVFQTGTKPTPMYLFGQPDVTEQRVNCGIAIPGMLSWLAYGDSQKPVAGLDQVPRRDWPPVAMTFHSFHIMVWLGVLFVVLTLVGLYFRWRGTLFEKRWLLWVFVWAVPLPYVANQLGWITAEVGRQPWVVYGLLRTSDALSKVVVANQVLGSIIMFIIIYAMLFAVWVFVLDSKIKHGPDEEVGPTAHARRGLMGVAGLRSGTGGASLTETDNATEKE
ncbi:MAG TPA: cytochrome ubiquinol oxidase subunit I [Verrucomicrobiae bacterium]|nr:cytochrome ubiquinol oxidase subunit I [Verrucomicrobiae bacterium]